MLLVHTSEVSVDFTGFPLSVSVRPDEFDTAEVVIDAAERADGAVPQRLNFRGRTEDVARVLREALDALES